jgi:hypothetical protein
LGDEGHGPGPAFLARHAHLDHDLLLQQQQRRAKKNDQGRLETEEGTATEADAVSFNVYLHFPTDEEIKLGRRDAIGSL